MKKSYLIESKVWVVSKYFNDIKRWMPVCVCDTEKIADYYMVEVNHE